jgi:hypothetical protein
MVVSFEVMGKGDRIQNSKLSIQNSRLFILNFELIILNSFPHHSQDLLTRGGSKPSSILLGTLLLQKTP